jgi:signal transduction histidine kinase
MLVSRRYEGVAGDVLTPGVPADPTFNPPTAGPGISVRRRAAPRSVRLAVLELAAAGLLLGFIELALAYSEPSPAPWWALALWPATAWAYLGAGAVAWLRRPSNRMGPIMVAGAFVCLVAGLETDVPVLVAAFLIVATLPLAVIVHVLHAFPSGRLRGRLSVATVAAGYVVWLVLEAPRYLFGQGPEGPRTVLQIADRPDLADIGQWAEWAGEFCVMVVTAMILVRRVRAAAPSQRRVLSPLYVYGIFTVLFVLVSSRVARIILDDPASIGIYLGAAQLAVVAGVPIAFVVALLRGGFARTGELQELGVWLGADRARPAFADALADVLGDPSLELLLATPGTDDYVDFRGRAAALPPAGSRRAAVEVVRDERRVGAIVYDATLIADRSLVEAAGRVVALALHNEQLTAELRAGRDRLRRALARTVAASDVERRRIARDLHDGLQGRLVLLAIQANAVHGDPTLSADARSDAAALGAGLQTAITELRDLVQGVMPAMLTERGLCAAAEELADRCPIPVALDLDRARGALPGPVESTGYFLVAEALANAVKHSRAAAVELRMTRENGRLRIELRDDGVGGAHANGGAGLRGMADRVEALDGRLRVSSPLGGGTGIVAELPCAL